MKPVGILLVSTGNVATSLHSAIGELLGRPVHLRSVALKKGDQWKEALAKVQKGVTSVDQGRGVLVLADIPGGTPFNVAQSLCSERSVEVIGGVNIPMILKAVQVSADMEISELSIYIEKYGRDHIDRGERGRVGDLHGR